MTNTKSFGHFDVVIVGAGIAGHALASALPDHRILMIEAGKAAEPLKIVATRSSQQAIAQDEYRAFGVGGTSTIWGGGLVPFSKLDLVSWPKSIRQSIHHFLPGALQFFTESPRIADVVSNYWEAELSPSRPGAPSCQALFQLRASELLVNLASSSSERMLLVNDHRVESVSPRSSREKPAGVAIKGKDGELSSATGEAVVIACGGIESLALLARSPEIVPSFPENGTYRGFSMHLTGLVGVAGLPRGQNPLECRQLPSEQLVPFLHVAAAGIPGHSAFRVNFQPVRLNLLPLLELKLEALPLWVEILKNAFIGKRSWLINIDGDQRPSVDSTVQIRDGCAQITLSIDDNDRHSIRRVQELTDEYLQKKGGNAVFLSKLSKALVGRSHHLGGLCSIPEESHRITGNLEIGNSSIYVLSTSAFRSFSFANPTLMLVQLALRMAEHFRKKYRTS